MSESDPALAAPRPNTRDARGRRAQPRSPRLITRRLPSELLAEEGLVARAPRRPAPARDRHEIRGDEQALALRRAPARVDGVRVHVPPGSRATVRYRAAHSPSTRATPPATLRRGAHTVFAPAYGSHSS
jgi:hypothetical protein